MHEISAFVEQFEQFLVDQIDFFANVLERHKRTTRRLLLLRCLPRLHLQRELLRATGSQWMVPNPAAPWISARRDAAIPRNSAARRGCANQNAPGKIAWF